MHAVRSRATVERRPTGDSSDGDRPSLYRRVDGPSLPRLPAVIAQISGDLWAATRQRHWLNDWTTTGLFADDAESHLDNDATSLNCLCIKRPDTASLYYMNPVAVAQSTTVA